MSEEKELLTNEAEETAKQAEATDNAPEQEETPVDPVAELEERLKEQKDKYLRLYADFDNFKKRNAKERLELIQTAGKDVIVNLLPVLDDLDRAMESAKSATEVSGVVEGMELIANKLKSTLEQRGLKVMTTKGETFDAELHEAITEIPAPNEEAKGTVFDEVEKGYKLGDKIIRFPKVVVAK